MGVEGSLSSLVLVRWVGPLTAVAGVCLLVLQTIGQFSRGLAARMVQHYLSRSSRAMLFLSHIALMAVIVGALFAMNHSWFDVSAANAGDPLYWVDITEDSQPDRITAYRNYVFNLSSLWLLLLLSFTYQRMWAVANELERRRKAQPSGAKNQDEGERSNVDVWGVNHNVTLLQLSDLHCTYGTRGLVEHPNESSETVAQLQNLAGRLEACEPQRTRPLILITGDITDTGHPEEMRDVQPSSAAVWRAPRWEPLRAALDEILHFTEALDEELMARSWRLKPKNSRLVARTLESWWRLFPMKLYESDDYVLIGLNSVMPSSGLVNAYGRMQSAQIQRLRECAASIPAGKRVVFAMHHHLGRPDRGMRASWFARFKEPGLVMSNASDLLLVLREYFPGALVIHGHRHIRSTLRWPTRDGREVVSLGAPSSTLGDTTEDADGRKVPVISAIDVRARTVADFSTEQGVDLRASLHRIPKPRGSKPPEPIMS
jgi:hypothetical protein